MTAPSQSGTTDQILIKLGEMSAQLAVVVEKLGAIPDHETRIRKLEQWRYGLPFAGLLALASAALSIYEALHH